MTTKKELIEKYSTGIPYTSPSALDWENNKIPNAVWCKAPVEELKKIYEEHFTSPPTDICYAYLAGKDRVLGKDCDDLTNDEIEWLSIDERLGYILYKETGTTVEFPLYYIKD